MEEKVEISKNEYKNLIDSDLLLKALEAAGVDNWDGYGYAYQEYWKLRGEEEDA